MVWLCIYISCTFEWFSLRNCSGRWLRFHFFPLLKPVRVIFINLNQIFNLVYPVKWENWKRWVGITKMLLLSLLSVVFVSLSFLKQIHGLNIWFNFMQKASFIFFKDRKKFSSYVPNFLGPTTLAAQKKKKKRKKSDITHFYFAFFNNYLLIDQKLIMWSECKILWLLTSVGKVCFFFLEM